MAGRKGREVAARVSGEVVGPAPPVARPLPRRGADSLTGRELRAPLTHTVTVRHIHEHVPVPAPELGIRWKMLAAYVFGLLMLLVVLGLLLGAGVIDLHALRPPWQETGR